MLDRSIEGLRHKKSEQNDYDNEDKEINLHVKPGHVSEKLNFTDSDGNP